MKIKHLASAATVCASLFSAGNAVAVTGDIVHAAYEVSIIPGEYESYGNKVVGSGVEFTDADIGWPLQFDISEYSVKVTFTGSLGFGVFDFNGYVLTDLSSNFSGQLYRVSSATTLSGFTGDYFQQVGNSLRINLSGLSARTGDTIVLSVPEPETYAMLLGGLGLLGWVARRKKRHGASR